MTISGVNVPYAINVATHVLVIEVCDALERVRVDAFQYGYG